MESCALTTAIVPTPIVSYDVADLRLSWLPVPYITIQLLGSDGKSTLSVSYSGVVASNLLTILNTANLSSNSLHKRIINKLLADGYLVGAVTGTAA